MKPATRSAYIIIGTLAVYALLVATHRGEFWPFSIYPMFSQAGNPWSRSLVRELPPEVNSPEELPWASVALGEVPGISYPLDPRGISQNDVANYISKTDTWSPDRIRGLRSIFAKNRTLSSPLLIMRVRGELVNDSVAVQAIPVIAMMPDTTYVNPSLTSN
jgi:hypothetical protein